MAIKVYFITCRWVNSPPDDAALATPFFACGGKEVWQRLYDL